MRIVQPSVAKRIAFSGWARKNGVNRRSSATYLVPDDLEIPAALMVGAQVDGRFVETGKPKTRKRKTKDRGPVEEPAPPVASEVVQESEFVFNPVDYPPSGSVGSGSEAEEAQEE